MKNTSILSSFLILLIILLSVGCSSQSEEKQSGTIDTIALPTKQITSGLSNEQIKESALLMGKDLGFEELVRNNEQYVGKIIGLYGRVNGVEEKDGKIQLWIRDDTTNAERAPRYVVNHQGKRYLYGDYLHVWGTVKGFYKDSSLSDYTPEIDALIIE